MRPTLGKRQLAEVALQLSDRDWMILGDLARYRLLSGQQVRRLRFTEHASKPAAARAATGALRRLAGHQLIRTLSRRVGGQRGGSDSYLWYLAPAGTRLLTSRNNAAYPRSGLTSEPGGRYIRHTLAVAEIAVQLYECAAAGDLEVLTLEAEPTCWQDYLDQAGVRRLLKPDLFTVTAANGSEFEQFWFIEIDLDTESAATIAAKIGIYDRYQVSGRAAHHYGVMPRVAWITPDQARADAIARIAAKPSTPGIHQPMTPAGFLDAVTETSARAGP